MTKPERIHQKDIKFTSYLPATFTKSPPKKAIRPGTLHEQDMGNLMLCSQSFSHILHGERIVFLHLVVMDMPHAAEAALVVT